MIVQIISMIKDGYSKEYVAFSVIAMLLSLLLSFAFHEYLHAFVAYKLGDPTPYYQGRVTLNPLVHIDKIGFILLLIFGFGWAKPVQFNPNNLTKLKSKKLMSLMISLAGVTGNFAIALVSSVLSVIISELSYGNQNTLIMSILFFLLYLKTFSIMLMAFNLIPIPPLDGFHVLDLLVSTKIRMTNGYRNFLMIAPKLLMMIMFVSAVIDRPIFSYLINIIAYPAELVINLVSLAIMGLF